MNRHLSLITITGILVLGYSLPAWSERGPRETVEAADGNIRALLKKQAPEDSPAAQTRDNKLREVVTALLDLDDMAQKALGRYWQERSEEERREYVTLMHQLVERSYLRQARNRTEYRVEYGTTNVNGDRAEVETTLRFQTRGRNDSIEIIYTLRRVGAAWRVVDIETDGASTVRNYRAQFRRIIQQQGFEELISRMRRRLEAGESDI